MRGRLTSALAAAAVAGPLALAGAPGALAEARWTVDKPGIDNFLTEHTLVYPDRAGAENLIHFGRFGNFDWYFPCQTVTGEWRLDDGGTLRLTYDDPARAPAQYRVARRPDGVALVGPDGTATHATLHAGNRLPYF